MRVPKEIMLDQVKKSDLLRAQVPRALEYLNISYGLNLKKFDYEDQEFSVGFTRNETSYTAYLEFRDKGDFLELAMVIIQLTEHEIYL